MELSEKKRLLYDYRLYILTPFPPLLKEKKVFGRHRNIAIDNSQCVTKYDKIHFNIPKQIKIIDFTKFYCF